MALSERRERQTGRSRPRCFHTHRRACSAGASSTPLHRADAEQGLRLRVPSDETRESFNSESPWPHPEEHRGAMRLEGWAFAHPSRTAASRPPQGEVIEWRAFPAINHNRLRCNAPAIRGRRLRIDPVVAAPVGLLGPAGGAFCSKSLDRPCGRPPRARPVPVGRPGRPPMPP